MSLERKENPKRPKSLDSLPPELMENVFSFFSIRDFANFSSCLKYYQEITREIKNSKTLEYLIAAEVEPAIASNLMEMKIIKDYDKLCKNIFKYKLCNPTSSIPLTALNFLYLSGEKEACDYVMLSDERELSLSSNLQFYFYALILNSLRSNISLERAFPNRIANTDIREIFPKLLNFAVLSESLESIKWLMFNCKFDPNIKDDQEQNAFSYADKVPNSAEIKKILKKPIIELLLEKRNIKPQLIKDFLTWLEDLRKKSPQDSEFANYIVQFIEKIAENSPNPSTNFVLSADVAKKLSGSRLHQVMVVLFMIATLSLIPFAACMILPTISLKIALIEILTDALSVLSFIYMTHSIYSLCKSGVGLFKAAQPKDPSGIVKKIETQLREGNTLNLGQQNLRTQTI